jgi:hypothetical protein
VVVGVIPISSDRTTASLKLNGSGSAMTSGLNSSSESLKLKPSLSVIFSGKNWLSMSVKVKPSVSVRTTSPPVCWFSGFTLTE